MFCQFIGSLEEMVIQNSFSYSWNFQTVILYPILKCPGIMNSKPALELYKMVPLSNRPI
jgi:hypothetical protein